MHTLSKVLAPGLRPGWVLADPAVIAKMVDAKQGMDTCANVPLQRLAAAFIEEGRMAAHLATLKPAYRENKQAMQAALAEELGDPGVSWTDQAGGFFLWLTLPAHVDATRVSSVAIEEGVAFIPGPAFSVSGRFLSSVFSTYRVHRACFGTDARWPCPFPASRDVGSGARFVSRVPVLVDGDEVVHDSKRILQYLDHVYVDR